MHAGASVPHGVLLVTKLLLLTEEAISRIGDGHKREENIRVLVDDLCKVRLHRA